MKLFPAVKLLVLISLYSSIAGAYPPDFPVLDCGLYEVSGRLRKNPNGDFSLVMNAASASPYEFLLLGGNFDEKFEHLDTRVQLNLYVPIKIASTEQPYVFIQAMKASSLSSESADSVQALGSKSCGSEAEINSSLSL